jgi:hypothetical protein
MCKVKDFTIVLFIIKNHRYLVLSFDLYFNNFNIIFKIKLLDYLLIYQYNLYFENYFKY